MSSTGWARGAIFDLDQKKLLPLCNLAHAQPCGRSVFHISRKIRLPAGKHEVVLMWLLMIVKFAINDPPSVGYRPVVRFQDFTTQEKCLAVKEWISSQLGAEVEKMNKVLKDKVAIGEVKDFVAVRFSAECQQR